MPILIQHQGQGPPLVLFHGWGFDSSVWQPVIPLMATRYTVYCVDLPGFGGTSLMSWDDFAACLLPQLPETFAVVGWSLGGLIASRLCADFPKRVTCLINIASSPCFIERPQWPAAKQAVFHRFYNELLHTPEKVLSEFLAFQLPRRHQITLSGLSPETSGLKQGLEWLMQWDLRDALQTIKVPVHYFFGRLDAIVPHALMQRMEELYPHFHYQLFPRAAHALFLTHPNEFLDALPRGE